MPGESVAQPSDVVSISSSLFPEQPAGAAPDGGLFGTNALAPSAAPAAGGMFGAAAGADGGLFGNSVDAGGSLFGAAAGAGAADSGGLFGNSVDAGGSLFGAAAGAGAADSGGLFGNSADAGGSLFGAAAGAGAADSGGLFGNSAAAAPEPAAGGMLGGAAGAGAADSGGLFGNSADAGGSLFGAAAGAGAADSGGLFGNSAAAAPEPAAGGMLGGAAGAGAADSGGLFGNSADAAAPAAGGMADAAAPAAGGMFGAAAGAGAADSSASFGNSADTGGSLLGGAAGAGAADSVGLFGNSAAVGGSLFGDAAGAVAADSGASFGNSADAGGSLFGAVAGAKSAAPAQTVGISGNAAADTGGDTRIGGDPLSGLAPQAKVSDHASATAFAGGDGGDGDKSCPSSDDDETDDSDCGPSGAFGAKKENVYGRFPPALVATARDQLSKLYVWVHSSTPEDAGGRRKDNGKAHGITVATSARKEQESAAGFLRAITLEGTTDSVGNGASPSPDDLTCHPALPPTENNGVRGLLVNSTGSRAAIYGKNFVRVMYLEMPEDATSGKRKTAAVGAYHNHHVDGVADVRWHPLAPDCLAILTGDGCLRFYDTSGRFKLQIADCMPGLELKVGPNLQRMSKEATQAPAVSFGFGRTSSEESNMRWETFAVFVAHNDGKVNTVCPVVPIGCRFSPALIAALRLNPKGSRGHTAWLNEFEHTLDLRGKPLKFAKKHVEKIRKTYGEREGTVQARVQRDLGHGAGLEDARDFIRAIDAGEEIEWTENGRAVVIPRTVLTSIAAKPEFAPAVQSNEIEDDDMEFHDLLVLPTEPQPTFVLAYADRNAVQISMLAHPVVPQFCGVQPPPPTVSATLLFAGKTSVPLQYSESKPGSPCKLSQGDSANTMHFFTYTRKRCTSIDLWKPLQELSNYVKSNADALKQSVQFDVVDCAEDTVGRVVAASGSIYGVAVLRQRRRNCRVVVSGKEGHAEDLSVDALRHSYQSYRSRSSGANLADDGDNHGGNVYSDDAGIIRITDCEEFFRRLSEKATENDGWQSSTALLDALNDMSTLNPKTVDYYKQMKKVTSAFKQLFADGAGAGAGPAVTPRKRLKEMNDALTEWAKVLKEESAKNKEYVGSGGKLEQEIEAIKDEQTRLEQEQQRLLKWSQNMSEFMEKFVARLHAIRSNMSTDNAFKEAVDQKKAEHKRLKAQLASLRKKRDVVQQGASERIQVACYAMDTVEYTGRKISRLFLFAREGDVLAYDFVRQTTASSAAPNAMRKTEAVTKKTMAISLAPADIRIAQGGGFAVVANGRKGTAEGGGTLAVLDLDRISARGMKEEPLAVTAVVEGFGNPQGVAIDPNRTFLLVADAGKQQVFTVKVNETKRSGVVDRQFGSPAAVVYDAGTAIVPASVAIQSVNAAANEVHAVVAHNLGVDCVVITLGTAAGSSSVGNLLFRCCMEPEPYSPRSIAVHPDGQTAFFTCFQKGTGEGRLAHLSLQQPAGGAQVSASFDRFVGFVNPRTVTVSSGRVFIVEENQVTNIELYKVPGRAMIKEQNRVLADFKAPLESAVIGVNAQITELSRRVEEGKRVERSNRLEEAAAPTVGNPSNQSGPEPLDHEM